MLELLIREAKALSAIEVVAVLTAIVYLLLAIRQNIWCWLFAAISTSLYIYLFFAARLYMESVLNGFYLAMAAYGWYLWRRGPDNDQDLPVTTLPLQGHVLALAGVAAISAVNGYLLATYTDAAFPYLDSLTTWAAIFTTWLVARKKLENWWYWLVIDLALIAIYWSRELHLTAILFAVYVAMIPFGMRAWRRSYLSHTQQA